MTARQRHFWQMAGVLAVIVAAAELFGGAEWMAESGIIHFIAVGYVAFAARRMFSKRIASDSAFHPLAVALLVSMGLFAVTHAIEYLSGSVLTVPEATEAVVITNLYMAAFLAGVYGVLLMLQAARQRTPFGAGVLGLGLANIVMVTAVMMPFLPWGFEATEETGRAGFVMLFVVFLLVLWYMRRLESKVSVLAPFLREVTYAYGIVVLSVIPEAVLAFVGEVSIPEWRLELLSHYAFYLGMSVFFLSFDRLRMLGGVYAELEEEAV